MKKTNRQHSHLLSKKDEAQLRLIALRFAKVKNYIYSNFGSVNGLQFLKYPKEIRNSWVKSKFAENFGLQARQWKAAFDEAFSNIKTNWSLTHNEVKLFLGRNNFTDEEKHYVNYLFKAYPILHKVLTYQDYEINPKFDQVDQTKMNKIVRRLVRKYHKKSYTKFSKSFVLDADMYKYRGDGVLDVMSLTPRKMIRIHLKDNLKHTGNLRLVLKSNRVEIHAVKNLKVKEKDLIPDKVIAVDKGFRQALTSSSGEVYGADLSKKMRDLSDSLNEKNKKRNKILALIRKLESKGRFKKARRIKQNNLGNSKRNKFKNKAQEQVKSCVNRSINELIEEKPSTLVKEDLTFQTKSKGKKPKKLNRWLSSWYKGYLDSRLEFKCYENSIDLKQVNPAYTSQICHACDSFGRRSGEKFYCNYCGGVYDSDLNASVNILKRYYDSKISLFTPYKKVKEILELRLLERRKTESPMSTVPTKSRELLVGEAARSLAQTARVNPTANYFEV